MNVINNLDWYGGTDEKFIVLTELLQELEKTGLIFNEIQSKNILYLFMTYRPQKETEAYLNFYEHLIAVLDKRSLSRPWRDQEDAHSIGMTPLVRLLNDRKIELELFELLVKNGATLEEESLTDFSNPKNPTIQLRNDYDEFWKELESKLVPVVYENSRYPYYNVESIKKDLQTAKYIYEKNQGQKSIKSKL